MYGDPIQTSTVRTANGDEGGDKGTRDVDSENEAPHRLSTKKDRRGSKVEREDVPNLEAVMVHRRHRSDPDGRGGCEADPKKGRSRSGVEVMEEKILEEARS